MSWLLPLAIAGRPEAAALEARGEWASALAAWEACKTDAQDGRFCTKQAEILAAQQADNFEGWSVLSQVRRNYQTLGSAEATAQIEAALQKGGPAAPELRRWLANEYAKQGETEKLKAITEALDAQPGQEQAAIFLANQQRQDRNRRIQYGCWSISGLVLLLGFRPGARPFGWRSALLAMATVGLPPLLLSWVYDETWISGFSALAAMIGLAVALSPRLPVWLSLPAFWAGVLGLAIQQGWMR